MDQFTLLFATIVSLAVGSLLGYFARQSIAQRQFGTLEAKLQSKIVKAEADVRALILDAKQKASDILISAKKEEDRRRSELLKIERFLLKKQQILDQKAFQLERRDEDIVEKVRKLKAVKESLEEIKNEALARLERVAGLTPDEAKKELLQALEKEHQQEILAKVQKLNREGIEQFEKKAKEMLALAIQKYALSQAQEITTTTVLLPSDEIKGRIIGKEGRNIRTFEKLTGTEVIVDDTPDTVVISGFDPIRRQIAKVALEKLIRDGRIQPARIENIIAEAQKNVQDQIREAGETALYETGVVGLDPKLVQILGRLRFRTSYGHNVLIHSIEVAHLAAALASELGANVLLVKKAGLLHDIGKALDYQVEGSHVEIGIKILEKFGAEKEVIDAVKSHHEEYPYGSLEAILIQAADQISGARPGARKDTVENYLQRLGALEGIATSFPGVEKAWALQAGREIRVFVKPEELDDLACYKLAKEIAAKIQQELKYPGEIKVTVIRESRVVEYAR